MKTNLLLTSLGLFFLFMLNSASAQIPTNGLVAYWPFNGNANDESGNGNNGTVYGASLANDRFGHPNSAYTFDGINDFIRINTQPSLRPPVISFSCWVNFISCPSWGVLFDNLSGDPWNGYEIEYASVLQQQIIFEFYTSVHSGVSSLATLDFNKWYHYVLTYDGILIKMYLNGVLVNQKATTGNLNYTNTVNATFGSRFTGTDAFFNGLLDDVRVYDHAITDQEIDALYHEGLTLPNDNRVNALALNNIDAWSSGKSSFSNILATPDGIKATCWSNGPNNNCWFKFQSQTGEITIGLKTGSDEGTIKFPNIALWDESGNEIACAISSSEYGNLEIFSNTLTSGQWYYISIDNAVGSTNSGTFSIYMHNGPIARFSNPTLSFTKNSGMIEIPVNLNFISSQPKYVNYEIMGGTAVLHKDFIVRHKFGDVTIPAGLLIGNIKVYLINDINVGNNSYLDLNLINKEIRLLKISNTFRLDITNN